MMTKRHSHQYHKVTIGYCLKVEENQWISPDMTSNHPHLHLSMWRSLSERHPPFLKSYRHFLIAIDAIYQASGRRSLENIDILFSVPLMHHPRTTVLLFLTVHRRRASDAAAESCRYVNLHAPSSPVNQTCCVFSLFSSIVSPSLSQWYGFHGNRGCGGEKRILYQEWVSYFFSFQFLSHTLSCSCSLSLSLPPSFTESQAVCRAINIINQHNSTALSSAGRDEEARGNVNMPAWSSLNQWYISHITWMRAGARKERQRGTGEADRERQITEEWKSVF